MLHYIQHPAGWTSVQGFITNFYHSTQLLDARWMLVLLLNWNFSKKKKERHFYCWKIFRTLKFHNKTSSFVFNLEASVGYLGFFDLSGSTKTIPQIFLSWHEVWYLSHWNTFTFLLWSHSRVDLAAGPSPFGREICWPWWEASGSHGHALLKIFWGLDPVLRKNVEVLAKSGDAPLYCEVRVIWRLISLLSYSMDDTFIKFNNFCLQWHFLSGFKCS